MTQYKNMGFQTGNKHWDNPASIKTQLKAGDNKIGVDTQFVKGTQPWNKGKGQLFTGSNNPCWRGGITLNPDYFLSKMNERRVKKTENGGSHTMEEWDSLKQKYGHICLCCKKSEPQIKLSRDHILPISKGGTDNIDNIQPLCRSCNCKKWATEIDYRTVTIDN